VNEPAAPSELTLLIVEDDVDTAEELKIGLRRFGIHSRHVVTGRDALRAVESDRIDLVLLDLGLPDLEGAEVCRRIRMRSTVPVIIMSGRTDEASRVEALDVGADDYICKPYSLREAVARIQAVVRRSSNRHGLTLVMEDLVLDRRKHSAFKGGRPLKLAAKEFDLLAFLMEEPDVVLSRQRIFREVWGTSWYGTGRTLDVHIAALRRKLGDPTLIETVRGIGFRLARPSPRAVGSVHM
jgi:two-component system, OmpR family, response regulator RegX3